MKTISNKFESELKSLKNDRVNGSSIFTPNKLQSSKYDMLCVHNNKMNKVHKSIFKNKQESTDSGTKMNKSKIQIWTTKNMFQLQNYQQHIQNKNQKLWYQLTEINPSVGDEITDLELKLIWSGAKIFKPQYPKSVSRWSREKRD